MEKRDKRFVKLMAVLFWLGMTALACYGEPMPGRTFVVIMEAGCTLIAGAIYFGVEYINTLQ